MDQHVEYLVFRPASSVKSLHELRCAVVVLETVVQRAREAEAREKRYVSGAGRTTEAGRRVRTGWIGLGLDIADADTLGLMLVIRDHDSWHIARVGEGSTSAEETDCVTRVRRRSSIETREGRPR